MDVVNVSNCNKLRASSSSHQFWDRVIFLFPTQYIPRALAPAPTYLVSLIVSNSLMLENIAIIGVSSPSTSHETPRDYKPGETRESCSNASTQ